MIVITGGPSVGKSTLLNELRKSGFTVVPEQATAVIKEGKILPWKNFLSPGIPVLAFEPLANLLNALC